jgi:hypothetical protein
MIHRNQLPISVSPELNIPTEKEFWTFEIPFCLVDPSRSMVYFSLDGSAVRAAILAWLIALPITLLIVLVNLNEPLQQTGGVEDVLASCGDCHDVDIFYTDAADTALEICIS